MPFTKQPAEHLLEAKKSDTTDTTLRHTSSERSESTVIHHKYMSSPAEPATQSLSLRAFHKERLAVCGVRSTRHKSGAKVPILTYSTCEQHIDNSESQTRGENHTRSNTGR